MLEKTTQIAPLSLPWPRRLGMRRSKSVREPCLHKCRLQLWTLVARLTAEKSANFSHDFHEIVSESLLDSMGCIVFEHGSDDA